MFEQPLRGLVLGKFLPPHRGHQLLVDFARHWVDELAVVVGSLPAEPIPGEVRWRWMRELFPDCHVLHLDEVLPQTPEETPDPELFWARWRSSLQRILPWPVDCVFASESYGERLAAELGARFQPLDLPRQIRPISGTQIREDPFSHWEDLPACVRPWFVRRVCLAGPESSGKSTLARQLAAHFQTVCVPEYAEILLRYQAGQWAESDFERLRHGQPALEEALARQANRLLFCDTDLSMSMLWSEELYGRCAPALAESAAARHYDLTLLCAPDLDWEPDEHRLRPQTRQRFFERCQALLSVQQRPFRVIRGQGAARFESACQALRETGLI